MSIYIYCSSIPVYNNTSPRNLQYCGCIFPSIPLLIIYMDSHTKAKRRRVVERRKGDSKKIDDLLL